MPSYYLYARSIHSLLNHLSSEISECFRTAPVAQHRMREGRKTRVVPLGANSHQEMETNGMKEAQKDFDTQVGHTPEATVKARCALWDGGDGGSVLSGARVIRHRLPQLASESVDIHTAFANRFWTPGLWHQKATMINSLATNYYGPATTKDPSALYRLASATNMYIPRDLNESADHAGLPILDPLGHLGDPIRLIRRPVTVGSHMDRGSASGGAIKRALTSPKQAIRVNFCSILTIRQTPRGRVSVRSDGFSVFLVPPPPTTTTQCATVVATASLTIVRGLWVCILVLALCRTRCCCLCDGSRGGRLHGADFGRRRLLLLDDDDDGDGVKMGMGRLRGWSDNGCREDDALMSKLEYSTRSAISAIRLVLIRNPWRVGSDKDRGSAVLATGTRVILDAWDLYLTGYTGLGPYFEKLAERDALPSLDELLVCADTIVKRYASTAGYRAAVSSSPVTPPTEYKFPIGPPWTPTTASDTDHTVIQEDDGANADTNADTDGEQSDSEDGSGVEAEPVDTTEGGTGKKKKRKKKKKQKKKTTAGEEEKGFKGDRSLANSILFRRDFLLWIELSYAIADGDIGRVMKVLMIWIFIFAGAGNRNYVNLLLELYCLFRYEASKEMKDAIWNNWLVNITGELGKWIEDDLLQEHYNKWLEDMLAKHGGRFDDDFFRYTISPTVDFFLRLREELEAAYELAERSKSHTSAHLRDEYRIMMSIFREDHLNYIRSGRSMGHIAIDLEDAGYQDLDDGKYNEFQERSTEHATVLDSLLHLRREMASASASTVTHSMSTASTSPPIPIPAPTSSSRDLSDSESEIDAVESGWVFRFDREEIDDELVEEDGDGDDIDEAYAVQNEAKLNTVEIHFFCSRNTKFRHRKQNARFQKLNLSCRQ
ncbi:hypothetical protein BDZ89DRAFT_1244215 [Hymenopellis radicata]|nr:hypothetical protein BDZ89DRAFT_1244215 [Hymenopellis radicata]